jgi:hypothetical protein
MVYSKEWTLGVGDVLGMHGFLSREIDGNVSIAI